MADIHHFCLTPTPTPNAWKPAYGMRDLFCLDAYRLGENLEMILTSDMRRHDILTSMFPDAQFYPIAGGTRLVLPLRESLVFDLDDHSVQRIVAKDPVSDRTANRNVVLAITVEPNAANVVDWLSYHRKHHGADSALLVVRAGPEWEVAAFAAELSALDFPQIILVTCDQPLGLPDQGPETDIWFAPGAPGKGKMVPPTPDPWRSPLQEVAILEVLRRRFLRHARAVLRCDPSDLIAPLERGTVFDAACSGKGFVRFRGVRVYPFSFHKQARLGDHNCRAFDGGTAENIWCVSPTQLPDDHFWRQFRVSSTQPDPASADLSYWRCMGIRFPGRKVSEMISKSSLVADPVLDGLVRRDFGTSPAAPPKAAPPARLKNDRILAVSTMKNEGPFILDWLAWHRSIGMTDFLVYTNDCTDGTDKMFDLLAQKGFVEHRQNPYRDTGEKPQHAAYLAAQDTEIAKSADWIMCMDVDEYLNIHVGDGTLPALFANVPDATMISFTWRLFGNADIGPFTDMPVTQQFTRCAPLLTRKPHQAWGFKTLFRNLGHYKKFGVHRPKGLRPEYLPHITYLNGSGHPMPAKMMRNGWRSSLSTVGYELATLNHYSLRSAESFLVKKDRGRVNHVNRDQGLNYWFRMNHNAEEDRSILTHHDRFLAEKARLLADPQIAAQHDACVAAHKTRITALMQHDDYRALYSDITGDRLRRLSRQLNRFGTKEFESGPDGLQPE